MALTIQTFTNTTRFPTRLLGKGLTCGSRLLPCSLVMVMLTACTPLSSTAEPKSKPAALDTALRVLTVQPPKAGETIATTPGLAARCQAWRLTHGQVAAFFSAARSYPESQSAELNARFYELPCDISGQLQADGKSWNYRINAAGKANWTHDGETRQFGCSSKACEPLILMMPDGNTP